MMLHLTANRKIPRQTRNQLVSEVMVNGRNLGFIGSVNSALERIKQGDILILNSDTIVPRGFIDRLADAARSSPDIGTVTPLSNNGEFVSFPMPNRANPVASRNEIERLDTISAKTNSGKIIDIPSGIGFCLYITRACLDEVGALSEDFARGYLEDVDFCLRARERELETFVRRQSTSLTWAPSHSGNKSALWSCAIFACWSSDFLGIARNARHLLKLIRCEVHVKPLNERRHRQCSVLECL